MMARFKIGNTPWNKGLKTGPRSLEVKLKLSLANKGRRNSPSTEFKKGKKAKNWNGFQKGNTPWNKGIKHSEETKNKISQKLIGRQSPRKGAILSEETKIKIGKAKRGLKWGHHSEESRLKIGRGNIGKLKGRRNSPSTEFKKGCPPKVITPVKDTSIEIKIQNFLKQLSLEFYTHKYIKEIEHSYPCDIFIPSMNMVIECDGNYWHKYPTGKEIDHIRTKELIEKGFKVLRIWGHEIERMGIDEFKEKIK